mmetsp:Transcript_33366/g.57157  ORF Transcript_33366/g.57157 Transcript_33366/m.57157 type:complete len:249 (+) Transcript_33366:296-1042(+)
MAAPNSDGTMPCPCETKLRISLTSVSRLARSLVTNSSIRSVSWLSSSSWSRPLTIGPPLYCLNSRRSCCPSDAAARAPLRPVISIQCSMQSIQLLVRCVAIGRPGSGASVPFATASFIASDAKVGLGRPPGGGFGGPLPLPPAEKIDPKLSTTLVHARYMNTWRSGHGSASAAAASAVCSGKARTTCSNRRWPKPFGFIMNMVGMCLRMLSCACRTIWPYSSTWHTCTSPTIAASVGSEFSPWAASAS